MSLVFMWTIGLAVGLAQLPMRIDASEAATTVAAAKTYGFTNAELERVYRGEVLTQALKEGSDKELAGVVSIWLPKPVAEFAEVTLEGSLLTLDPSIRSLRVWKPDESADKALSDLHVDAAQQAMLQRRQEAYRKNGLKGAGSPGELLTLAINETNSLEHRPGYARALLSFPADSLPGMEHRFFAYEQEVEGQRTFILSHRSAVREDHHALITEQRYYVSQGYECRFIASDCFEARGGTLLFYVTRIFTDRVAGVGSGLKHSLGRRKMLADVAEKQKRAREQLLKVAAGSDSKGRSAIRPRRAAATNHEHQQQSRTRHRGRAGFRQSNTGRRRLPNPARR
jgi:hypothetical protein